MTAEFDPQAATCSRDHVLIPVRIRLKRGMLRPMFTGLVQHLGRIAAVEPRDFGLRLVVDIAQWSHRPVHGDSIAVNGCCLTVVAEEQGKSEGEFLQFDVIQQTLDVTTLGGLRTGDHVNLEHAVTPSTMLGGHIVQGHIDGIGMVTEVINEPAQYRLRIEPPESLMECIVEKGSIAVNGVSLTVTVCSETQFEVALIPTTLQLTNLGQLRPGMRVNLEADYIAKVVVNWLRRTGR